MIDEALTISIGIIFSILIIIGIVILFSLFIAMMNEILYFSSKASSRIFGDGKWE
jgi:hypothetical protein